MSLDDFLEFETENFEGSGPQTPEVASFLTENGEVSRLPDDCTSLCHRGNKI
ncbi:hypothetical protein RUM43_012799 [Polyplax serrata]|uniref:Uncharacterized protein n=1 Tax=Polyplax serrata TaxID=468196 RepID=A0AAN8P2G6_POLSC